MTRILNWIRSHLHTRQWEICDNDGHCHTHGTPCPGCGLR